MKDFIKINASKWLVVTVVFVMIAGIIPQELFAWNPAPGCFYGQTKSMGFWKNHPDNYVLPQSLGCGEIIDTQEKAVAVFESANAQEMKDMLKAQLLAMNFNIAYFGIGEYIAEGQTQSFNSIVAQADSLLCNNVSREEMESMKNLLDYLNNLHEFIYCPSEPEIPGCTDPEANNYNPNATQDDGSCQYDISGCTDPEALNYNSQATIDDGSCQYPEPEPEPDKYSISGKKFNDLDKNGEDNTEPGLEGWSINLTGPDQVLTSATTNSQGAFVFSNLEAGAYTLCEESKTNWIQSYPVANNGCHIADLTNSNIENIKFGNYYQKPQAPISGCTDPDALNYNHQATVDNGSCQYPQNGNGGGNGGGGGDGLLNTIGGGGSSGRPNLRIEKKIDEKFTNPGGVITFVIEVENTASGMAYSVALKDVLPEGFSYKGTDSSRRGWVLEDIEGWSKRTITYQVKVGDNVEPGIYINTVELTSINHEKIYDSAEIEVREPIVLGEETVVEKPKPEPKRDVLPKTGVDSFAVYLLLGFALLINGLLSIISVFAKKHKKRIQIALSVSLIIGALTFLSYPFWPLIDYQTKIVLAEVLVEEDNESGLKLESAVELEKEGNYLVIPKIGVEIPIVLGDDESALERGAWLLPESSTPDLSGNTILAGHRYKYRPPSKKTFYLLDKLEKGDLLQVFWEGEEYRYIVISSEIVLPEQVEVLAQTEKPTLTLITCYPLFSDEKRLVVKGELI